MPLPACRQATPFAIVDARVARSPFARKRGRTLQEATALVRRTVRRVRAGESVGFSALMSLKSMGLIARADGAYELGPKYCT